MATGIPHGWFGVNADISGYWQLYWRLLAHIDGYWQPHIDGLGLCSYKWLLAATGGSRWLLASQMD